MMLTHKPKRHSADHIRKMQARRNKQWSRVSTYSGTASQQSAIQKWAEKIRAWRNGVSLPSKPKTVNHVQHRTQNR